MQERLHQKACHKLGWICAVLSLQGLIPWYDVSFLANLCVKWQETIQALSDEKCFLVQIFQGMNGKLSATCRWYTKFRSVTQCRSRRWFKTRTPQEEYRFVGPWMLISPPRSQCYRLTFNIRNVQTELSCCIWISRYYLLLSIFAHTEEALLQLASDVPISHGRVYTDFKYNSLPKSCKMVLPVNV